ncbi:MAG: cell division protein [Alphaproteobacteria bacterium]|nr:cell division protein [Alphaproteobacteria bacterium]
MPNQNAMIARKKELPLQDDSSNLFLQVMICIAVFLFGVTLAGVLSINSMLATWNESILGSLTVQVMPINDINAEQAKAQTLAQQEKAVELLQSKPEVDKVTPLNNEQLQKLIQPWLGDGVEINELPIPRLIDVRLKPGAEVDFIRWAEELAEAAPQASLDNHKLWLNKLIKFADGLKVLALAVLALVIVITSGAIFYCTQTSLGLHKHIIEILHLMGAKDTYVAQQYAKRTAWLGFLGGIYGLFLAIPTIFVIANLARQIEGGIISEARLTLSDWSAILSLPLFSMLIAMMTAYYTVKKTLEKFM